MAPIKKFSLVVRQIHNKTNLSSVMKQQDAIRALSFFYLYFQKRYKSCLIEISSEQNFKRWVRVSIMMNDSKEHFHRAERQWYKMKTSSLSLYVFWQCILLKVYVLFPDLVTRSLHSHFLFKLSNQFNVLHPKNLQSILFKWINQ